jgi:hypothetical protein
MQHGSKQIDPVGRRRQNCLAGLGGSWSLTTMSHQNPYRRSRTGIAPPGVECFVSRAELARIMGVSVATVDRMVTDGMPSVTWGRRTRRFRPTEALSWASQRGRAA